MGAFAGLALLPVLYGVRRIFACHRSAGRIESAGDGIACRDTGVCREPYVIINGNEPDFTEEEWSEDSFEMYSEQDSLGRCGTAYACVGRDLMPTEERGSIGQVKPTGWHTIKYDSVDGKYLYNRRHLIGYQLSGENDNEQNLITGTRYMNVEGMLPSRTWWRTMWRRPAIMCCTG